MRKYLIIYLICFGVVILQNIIHEISHILMAKFKGISIRRIQWFTYSKFFSTRIFYENEPDLEEEFIDRKWGWIASAGFLGTTILGYLLTGIYIIEKNNFNKWILLLICLSAIVFIIFDSLYFFIGSIFNFGDMVGIKKVFSISKRRAIIISTVILIINIIVANRYLWN